MDPATLVASLLIGAGVALAGKSGKRKQNKIMSGQDPLFKSGTKTGKGLIIPDVYWREFHSREKPDDFSSRYYRKPKWNKLVGASDLGIVGCILKASDGAYWSKDGNIHFFVHEWERLREAGGARYGVSWFRGAYHYLRAGVDGRAQGENFIRTVEKAGGWKEGDCVPFLDIEAGGEINSKATPEMFLTSALEFCDVVHSHWGRKIGLYGRSVPNKVYGANLDASMGCDLAWNPAWTSRIGYDHSKPGSHAMPPPFTRETTLLWQYSNGTTNLTTFPTGVPGFIKTLDMNVFLGSHTVEMHDLFAFKRRLCEGDV